MKADKRRERILRFLKNNPSMTNASLSENLGVTKETIRNDLILLETEGILKRSHGRSEILQSDAAYEKLRRSGILSKEERREEILKIIEEKGEARAAVLSNSFSVSEGTIRNDLITLEKNGRIKRTHGGAVLMGSPRQDTVISSLIGPGFPAKVRYLCERALSLSEAGDVIFIDNSIYSLYIALNVPLESEITIVTNSLKAACILAQRHYPSDVFMLPGLLQTEDLSIEVKFREALADFFFITKAFLGFQAYTPKRGFFVATDKQFDLFSMITDMSEAFYILLDSQSINERGRYGFPIEEKLERLGEIMVDDGLTADEAGGAFPENYPVALCGENYALKSPFKKQFIIGFSSLYGSYDFSQTVRNSIEEAARRYSSIELILADNKMNPETTMRNIETFIRKKVDLVIEYQHDYRLGPLIVEKLAHANIPILAIDIPIPGAVYFGANNYKAGLIAGEQAAKEVMNRWNGALDNIIVMTDNATGPIPENRIAGMLEAFLRKVPFEQERIIKVNTSNNTQKSEKDISAIMSEFPEESRNLILSFNDIVSLGVLRALKSLKLERNSLVVSHSNIRSIAKELSRPGSPLLGSVAFFPERYGTRIIDLALKMLRKEAVNPNNYTDHLWMARRS